MRKLVGKTDMFYYNPKRILGIGQFGHVFLGKKATNNEFVAIKVMNIDQLRKKHRHESVIKFLRMEIRVMQKLTKKNLSNYLLKIYDCIEVQDFVYIILEYCPDGTLQDRIYKNTKDKKYFSLKEVLITILQIAQGIRSLHSMNIVHRDLKPENIFMSGNTCKIGDFGFSSDQDVFKTQLGTLPYMAPELLQNRPDYSVQIDVWALGVMFHEMLFNELPFKCRQIFQLKSLIESKPYQFPTTRRYPKELKNLLMKMFRRNPRRRITASQLCKEIEDLLQKLNYKYNPNLFEIESQKYL